MTYDATKPNTSQTIGDVILSANANDVAIKLQLDTHQADLTAAHGIGALLATQADYVTHKANTTNAHGIDTIAATASATSSEVIAARGVAASLVARLNKATATDGSILLSSLQNKWLDNGDTPTYVDSQHFTVPTDRTKVYIAGAHLRMTISGSYVYAPIASSSYGSSATTVTLDPNYLLLTSGLSKIEIGLLSFDYAIQNSLATATANITALQAQVAALQLPFRKNLVMNGGCVIAQRNSTINLSTAAQSGQVDAFACWATGTLVTAGTITQDTASPVGRKGYAVKVAGATITGSGVVLARARIESKDAKQFKNQTASFSLRVYQDTGGSINYTVIVRKPSATPDDFSSVTLIGTSAVQAVATATDTLITFQALAMADCSNGIEIEVQAACGAVTTKNFSFTEWKAEEGAISTPFEHKQYVDDYEQCQRRLWILGGLDANEQLGDGQATTTTAALFPMTFPVEMRIAPTLSVSAAADAACLNSSGTPVACSALTAQKITRRSLQLSATVASGLVAGNAVILQANGTTNTRLTFNAEL